MGVPRESASGPGPGDAGPEGMSPQALATVVSVVNRGPMVVFLWRVAEGWPVEFVSDSVRQFGYTPEDFTSARVSWVEVTHAEDVPRLEAELVEHRKRGCTEFSQEYRLLTPDGRVRWVDDRTMAICDAQGQVTHYAGAIRDITERKEAETALRRRDGQLTLALDAGGMGMWEWNFASQRSTATARQLELAGLPEEAADIDVTRFLAQIHPDDKVVVQAAIRLAIDTGVDFRAEFRLRHPDGTYRWLAGAGRVIRDAGHHPVGMLGVNTDITARKLSEQALRQSEERLALALASAEMGWWEWDIASNRTTANARERELAGLADAGVEYDTERFYAAVHPDDRDRVRRHVADVMARDGQLACEFRVVHPDGTCRWLAGSGRLVRDAAGRGLRMLGVNYDVTARREAEDKLAALNTELEARVVARTSELQEALRRLESTQAELRLREAQYRGLAENTRDILFAVDPAGVVTFIGPQTRAYGLAPDGIVGRPAVDFVVPGDVKRIQRELSRVFVQAVMNTVELRVPTPDGRHVWFEAVGALQWGPGGQPLSLTGVLRDITERKEAERIRLRQEQRVHDLVARLASAQDDEHRGFADWLHEDIAQLLAACSYRLAELRRAAPPVGPVAQEVADLLGDVQRRVREHSRELVSGSVLHEGLEDALRALCASMSAQHGMRFVFDDDGLPKPLAREHRFMVYRAVRELMFNVVKHAGVTEARVCLRRDGTSLCVGVEDQGRGFSASQQAAMTEGWELDGGLGLFSVRERVRRARGKLRVDSEPGVRTCVSLHLPLARP